MTRVWVVRLQHRSQCVVTGICPIQFSACFKYIYICSRLFMFMLSFHILCSLVFDCESYFFFPPICIPWFSCTFACTGLTTSCSQACKRASVTKYHYLLTRTSQIKGIECPEGLIIGALAQGIYLVHSCYVNILIIDNRHARHAHPPLHWISSTNPLSVWYWTICAHQVLCQGCSIYMDFVVLYNLCKLIECGHLTWWPMSSRAHKIYISTATGQASRCSWSHPRSRMVAFDNVFQTNLGRQLMLRKSEGNCDYLCNITVLDQSLSHQTVKYVLSAPQSILMKI